MFRLASVFILSSCLLAVVSTAGGAVDPRGEFVGSETCKKCHKTEYESWKETYHSKMVRPKGQGILTAAVEKWETDGTTPGPKKGNVTGKECRLDDVVYVVGSFWKQRYLVKNDETGNHQFMDKQFNRVSGKWENYGQKNDWEFMCATCHATGYRLMEYDAANPKVQKATWIEENTGCEACHGPGAEHVKKPSAKTIWNPAKQSKADQTRACGYCHIRLDNHNIKTPQGNDSEHFPAPKAGDTFKPWDDWTKWYPEKVTIPGVQPDDPFDKEYTGDLKGIFILDDLAKKTGYYDSGKHHQQYQEYIQSKHFKKDVASCSDCHMPHKGKKIKTVVAKDTCASCHGDQYDYSKVMPATGGTAKDLGVRVHTFYKEQNRPSKMTATGTPEYFKK